LCTGSRNLLYLQLVFLSSQSSSSMGCVISY
jgi:hypothetical protein